MIIQSGHARERKFSKLVDTILRVLTHGYGRAIHTTTFGWGLAVGFKLIVISYLSLVLDSRDTRKRGGPIPSVAQYYASRFRIAISSHA